MIVSLISIIFITVNLSSSSEEQYESDEKVFLNTTINVKQQSYECISQSSLESYTHEVCQSRASLHSVSSQMNASSNSPVHCSEPSISDHSVISDQSLSANTNGIFLNIVFIIHVCILLLLYFNNL